MIRHVLKELKNHSPFTMLGAVSGIVIMLLFYKIPAEMSLSIFYTLHPIHVVLSAFATASMYKLHVQKPSILIMILIGYFGSVGIATLSDSIIPYLGELMLNLPNRGLHLGFIEKWWLVNPLAFVGIGIAFFKPKVKFPHFGHVLLSTWASLFHILMALGGIINVFLIVIVLMFLFISVWIPCCLSDIVFPLLFVKKKTIHGG